MGTSGDGERGAAASLAARKDMVLRLWEEEARAALPAAQNADRVALLDALPGMVDTLVAVLRAPSPSAELSRHGRDLGGEHGEQRARLDAFSLEQVVDEYRLFRKVMFDVLELDGPLPRRERDLLLEAIHLSVRNAVRELARCRAAEQERAAAELKSANQQLDALLHERTRALSHSEARFEHLVQSVKDYAIFTLDTEGNVTTWNPGAERMKGYGPDEIIGVHFSILYPTDGRRRDEPMEHLRRAADEGRFRGEGLRIRKNGDYFLADVCITPMYEQGKLIGFSKVVEDLTERMLLLQERDISRSDLDQYKTEVEHRDRFVATLTHDLRSPLSAIVASAALLARHPDDADTVRQAAARIRETVKRTEKLLVDLLDATRLQAGGSLPLQFEPCDLRQIVDDLRRDFEAHYPGRLQVVHQGETDGRWSADGLRRVLDNLISNAFKYGEADKPITVSLKRVEDREYIAVHNEGTLIPAEEQAKLFQPFHRTASATASGKEGWGLGLALVKAIVDAHGGMVKVESYPKAGTTFTVDLPIDALAQEPGLPDSAR